MSFQIVTKALAPIAQIWDNNAPSANYLKNFKGKHKSLRIRRSQLGALRDEMYWVGLGETRLGSEGKRAVDLWLEKADVAVNMFYKINHRVVRVSSKNLLARYKLGKKVCKWLIIGEELISEGKELLADVFNEGGKWVGKDEVIIQFLTWVADDDVKIIGIWGRGGVGKTTLLKKINNAFLENDDEQDKEDVTFDLVIWVVVSRKWSIENIQKNIGERLGLMWSYGDNQDEKAQRIRNVLSNKRFLLLLDDLWETIDLQDIGIPSPHISSNNSKVVFTTRSLYVCESMKVSVEYKVPVLEPVQAWELFWDRVRPNNLEYDREIRDIAESVAKECGGLPLALVAIGRAMASKKTFSEWNLALETLRKYAYQFSGMEQVLAILKLSYDYLENDTVRGCFLYFSLYSEDCEIPCNEIIFYWIADELIDEFEDLDDAINMGYDIIGSLEAACLLETSYKWGKSYVKMHDLVREFALWIARGCGKYEKYLVVQAGVGLIEAPNMESWKDAERISLMCNKLQELTGAPKCPHLVSLMLQKNFELSVISHDFFYYMPILRVLDLSKTGIKFVPESIGGLLHLQFLNLYRTNIESCPEELGNLAELKYLNLGGTKVRTIPRRMISRFPSMQVLDLGNTKLDEPLAEELESLEQLRELGIAINKITSPLSQKLTSCITILLMRGKCVGLTELALLSSSFLKKARRLRALHIGYSRSKKLKINSLEEAEDDVGSFLTLRELYLINLPELTNITWVETTTHLRFKHLARVYISNCDSLKDISWLVLVPFLRVLVVKGCSELEEIIFDKFALTTDGNQDVFSRLELLRLEKLPNLKSIINAAILFPCLDELMVYECPMLKKLPLTTNSINKSALPQIRGEAEWQNNLKLADKTKNSSLQPFIFNKEENDESESKASSQPYFSALTATATLTPGGSNMHQFHSEQNPATNSGDVHQVFSGNNQTGIEEASIPASSQPHVSVSGAPLLPQKNPTCFPILKKKRGSNMFQFHSKKNPATNSGDDHQVFTANNQMGIKLASIPTSSQPHTSVSGAPSSSEESNMFPHPGQKRKNETLESSLQPSLFEKKENDESELKASSVPSNSAPTATATLIPGESSMFQENPTTNSGDFHQVFTGDNRTGIEEANIPTSSQLSTFVSSPPSSSSGGSSVVLRVEEKVLPISKSSYDILEDDTARICFQYFALYPTYQSIHKDEIVRQWIVGGFLDEFKILDDAVVKGHAIIASLITAGLLQDGDWEKTYVKVCNNVGALALEMAQRDKFLVQVGAGLTQAPDFGNWKAAERISLAKNDMKELTGVPECPCLLTLMLQCNTHLSIIPNDFFQFMPNLRVLDLSSTGIRFLPKSIGCLLQLQLLNLSKTRIRILPDGLRELVKLKYLSLADTDYLKNVPHGMISRLSMLQVLNLGWTSLDSSMQEDLEALEKLGDLGIRIQEFATLRSMLLSEKLSSCITTLSIVKCPGLIKLALATTSSLLRNLKRLLVLSIVDCLELKEFKINSVEEDKDISLQENLEVLKLVGLPRLNILWSETSADHFKHLREVHIHGCDTLKDISWLVLVPFLRFLLIEDCQQVEEIILEGTENQSLFSAVVYFVLTGLPKLKSITRHASQFPYLELMSVSACPLLKKLPFARNNTDRSSLLIEAEAEWWNQLQWEDEMAKSSLEPCFIAKESF